MMVRTRTKGTMVVNQEREEICGISCKAERGADASAARPAAFPPTSPRPLWLALCAAEGLSQATYLQDEEEQEVGVGDFLELLEEVDRQEGENVVLGGLDAVTLWRRGGEDEAGSGRAPEPARGCRPQLRCPKPLPPKAGDHEGGRGTAQGGEESQGASVAPSLTGEHRKIQQSSSRGLWRRLPSPHPKRPPGQPRGRPRGRPGPASCPCTAPPLRGAAHRILELLVVLPVVGPRPPLFFCNRAARGQLGARPSVCQAGSGLALPGPQQGPPALPTV